MRKKRILLTSYSGEFGGMELRMIQEAAMLSAAGYEVVLAPRKFDDIDLFKAHLSGLNVEFDTFSVPPFMEEWKGRRLNLLRSNIIHRRRLKRWQVDLVHVFLCWTTYGLSALHVATAAGIPTVASAHNVFPEVEFPPWSRARIEEACSGFLGVYSVSQSAHDAFRKVFDPYLAADTIVRSIPNGVDTNRFVPSPAHRQNLRNKYLIADDELVIGAVMRLSDQKRPLLLLEVFSELIKTRRGLRLIVVGNGPLERQMRQKAADLGLGGNVIFAGQVSDTATVYPAFDIHLLLSQREGFGLVTAEAMSCGVPAVGTDIPGTRDILQGNKGGLLVPLDGMAEIVESIGRLISNPGSLTPMGLNAREHIVQNFSQTRWMADTLDFYKDVLAAGRFRSAEI